MTHHTALVFLHSQRLLFACFFLHSHQLDAVIHRHRKRTQEADTGSGHTHTHAHTKQKDEVGRKKIKRGSGRGLAEGSNELAKSSTDSGINVRVVHPMGTERLAQVLQDAFQAGQLGLQRPALLLKRQLCFFGPLAGFPLCIPVGFAPLLHAAATHDKCRERECVCVCVCVEGAEREWVYNKTRANSAAVPDGRRSK